MKRSGHGAYFLASFLLLLTVACSAQSDVQSTQGAERSPGTPGLVNVVEDTVDGYVALAPRVLHSGQQEAVSFSLLAGDRPARSTVQIALLRDGNRLATGSAVVDGQGSVPIVVPQLAEGEYQVEVSGKGFKDQSSVRVEDGTLLFLETDKPIYKPGQTMHVRVLSLNPELKPLPGEITVEAQDAKGIKVFKKVVQADDFGMATLDLPLSTEPNLGVWKLSAHMEKRTAQLDVRVEEYVLPKYEVRVNVPKEWVLAGDHITGTVAAEYSFGKPVKGDVTIKATRYVGTWQEFASFTKPIDGNVSFDLPAAGYVAGVPGAQGMGNVSLEIAVKEASTGYEEKTTRLLTVAAAPVTLQVIPESSSFKPALPLNLLVVAVTPDKKPADADARVVVTYTGKQFQQLKQETLQASVRGGKAMLQLTPPADAVALSLTASTGQANTALSLEASYSPSSNFIHLEQTTSGELKVGDTARFHVTATREAPNFYFEVLGRGKVVYSSVSRTPDIEVPLTPLMAPSARLLVYQILPNSEVAADYLPLTVSGDYPQQVDVAFSKSEAKPGEDLDINVSTQGPAKVGLAAVDRSVFILAENRVNLQQVFAELEKLYLKPQAEIHSAGVQDTVNVRGAKEMFQDAGVVVLSNKSVPAGQKYESPRRKLLEGGPAIGAMAPMGALPAAAAKSTDAVPQEQAQGLADVQRVRQFFPETWLWQDLTTGPDGKGKTKVTAPDSITSWMLRAVALSKDRGLGIAEAQLKVFQPFFFQVDLPYSAVRGEEFPVKVALYNYQNSRQEFVIDLDQADWFDLLEPGSKTVAVGANDVGSVTFKIRPRQLGTNKLKVTARSTAAADAVVKELLVEPEGVAREDVDNLILTAGASKSVNATIPAGAVAGSGRILFTITGNYLTQTIEGLEKLLQMPFGCGEQNMILFAPNVFVSRYLKQTDQLKPEVMAKSELMMTTGYQREMTYRRQDGSFSAFGQQDKEGSLWLTAFVLKTFAQAKELIYIDEAVLQAAKSWIVNAQKADGSFDPVGFVIHQELQGGMNGKTSLTAYMAIALKEAGDEAAAGKATRYLEGQLDAINDSYTMAIVAYALEMTRSPRAGAAYDKLMGMAKEDDNGLHWGDDKIVPLPQGAQVPNAGLGGIAAPVRPIPQPNRSALIETTGYATLALIEHGDRMNASRGARWLVSQRNAYGGFGSTQDTVVGLQALTRYAADARSDVDATVKLSSGNWSKEVRITPENADVLQVIEIPQGGDVTVATQGKGQVVAQMVRRFNLPKVEEAPAAFQIKVDYGADNVAVNDLINISSTVKFNPPMPLPEMSGQLQPGPIEAGMVVLDVAIPTGFAAVPESLATMLKQQPRLKRYDVAGRKVIIYIENMQPNEQLSFAFQARALYPVKAQAVTSSVYSYYRPEWRAESLGGQITASQ